MLRVEDKYLVPYIDYCLLRERLSAVALLDYYSEGKPDGYKISSLYFDDMYDSNYYDTVSGNPIRKKYRIRLYNDSLAPIKLEVKTKYYSRISKESCLISVDEMNKLIRGELIEWGETRDNPRSAFNEAISVKKLVPKIIVTYERNAFVYDFGNMRITFDHDIRTSNLVEYFGKPGIHYSRLKMDNYILEVKYDEFIPDFMVQTLRVNTMWQTSFSKYRICCEMFRGGQ